MTTQTLDSAADIDAAAAGVAPWNRRLRSFRTELRMRAARPSRKAQIREIRNAADAAAVVAALTPVPAFFGDFAVDYDFAKLLCRQLERRPDVVVECGSGVSTLLTANAFERRGAGHLISLENDPMYAAYTRDQLDLAGLGHRVDVVVAPLKEQTIAGESVRWYDLDAIDYDGPIDLLVVDGPPSIGPLSRWPALPAFWNQLSERAVVLMDDGRRLDERAIAFRWSDEYPTKLYWVDTVKGAWQITRGAPRTGPARKLQRVARRVNPTPFGFGLTPVER
jgi:predicted O-methyltransferase YrrM